VHRELEVGMFEHHRPESLLSEIVEDRQKGVGGTRDRNGKIRVEQVRLPARLAASIG